MIFTTGSCEPLESGVGSKEQRTFSPNLFRQHAGRGAESEHTLVHHNWKGPHLINHVSYELIELVVFEPPVIRQLIELIGFWTPGEKTIN